MLLCLNFVKFLKIKIGISLELFELAQWNFAWLVSGSRGSFSWNLMRPKERQAVQPDQPAYQMKKWKNWITSIIFVRSGWNFAWSFFKRFPVIGMKKSLGIKIFLPTAHPARNGTYRDFFKKLKKLKTISETWLHMFAWTLSIRISLSY